MLESKLGISTESDFALTNEIDNRQVYAKGMDASYNYEGYYAYKTEDLV